VYSTPVFHIKGKKNNVVLFIQLEYVSNTGEKKTYKNEKKKQRFAI